MSKPKKSSGQNGHLIRAELGQLLQELRAQKVSAFEGFGLKVQFSPLALVEQSRGRKPAPPAATPDGVAAKFPDEDKDLFHSVG